ncbi:CdaR family protein [Paenibacillus zanthoxyli]|uniref:CdaR family protein n=1 Tax=Paenibacillus zanthoxyli TaxID=369399 RepID=UPI000471FCFD|nr:CdaR family protein [Paenibacillus zanthoxyli]
MDKWMNNNNFNKILAVAFSIILWAMVHIDSAPTAQSTARLESKIIENIPIQMTGQDNDKYEYSMDADSVRMEVMGKRSDITYMFSDAYKVTIDLSKAEPGTSEIPLKYSLPRGVELISITPKEVHVHIEQRVTKSFPVTVVTKGTPAQGYQFGTPVAEPGAVKVTLAASEIARMAKVQGTIELNGENETVTGKRMKLAAYDANGKEIKDAVIEPASVSVEIPVTLPYKSVPLKIGYTGSLPDSLVLSKVTPEVDKVVIYGQEAALASVASYEATIDLSSINGAGTSTLKLDLKPPDGIQDIAPKSVNVTVVASEMAERTLQDIPITLEGVRSGLSASVTSPAERTISLTLSGARSLLDQLNKDDIKAVADLSGLSAGNHVVPLQVSLPSFIELSNKQRTSVTVQLYNPASSASPSATPASGSTATPEPSTEPVSGGGSVDEPAASADNGASEEPTPTVSPDGGDNPSGDSEPSAQ